MRLAVERNHKFSDCGDRELRQANCSCLCPCAAQRALMIEIFLITTSDTPDGQPWPPPDSNALWAVVRRADGCTLWRAIQLAQVRYRCHGLLQFL